MSWVIELDGVVFMTVERRGLPLNPDEPLMDYPRIAAEILVA
jgi:hypothetical protein